MADIKPLRSEEDYEQALVEVEQLWGAELGTPDGDRLDVLATLIDAYEAEHYPMDPPDPIEAIKFRMEQQGLSRRDLEAIIGTRSRVAEVLNRRRNLSISMIRRLHESLGIPAEVLIRPNRGSSDPTAPVPKRRDVNLGARHRAAERGRRGLAMDKPTSLGRQAKGSKVGPGEVIRLSRRDAEALMAAVLDGQPAGPRLRQAAERYREALRKARSTR